jgi:hypothetical protein
VSIQGSYHQEAIQTANGDSLRVAISRTSEPSNKGMKLTKLSAAPLLGRSAASCPRRQTSDTGTASQLIPGVLRTVAGRE